MASLRFSFNGDRRNTPRQPPLGGMRPPYYPSPFMGRTLGTGRYPRPFLNPVVVMPKDEYSRKQDEETCTPKEEEKPVEEIIKTEVESLHGQKEEERPHKNEETSSSPVLISENFINHLDTFNTGLFKLRGNINSSKNLFDDLLYKLESFAQIIEIMRANEERKTNGPQAQVSSLKTSKDSVDELLELLQTPAFQSVLRQILIGVLVKN